MIDEDKLKSKIEELKSNLIHGACSSQIAMETCCKEEAYNEVLSIIDSEQEESNDDWKYFIAEKLGISREEYDKIDYNKDYGKEEPVSEFLNTESMIESYKQRLISQANGMKNSPFIDMCLASYKHGINETLDTLKLSNLARIGKN